MDISVIVCTWNNCKQLKKTLESFCDCEVPASLKWELVLVNNNCTDETDRVAQSFDSRLPLVIVHESKQGLSRAKNAGIQTAQGELIVFTDDDVTPCRNWISSYWRAFREKPSGYFFGGAIRSEFEGKSPPAELLRLAVPSVKGLDWGNQERELKIDEFFISANWACPAVDLKKTGGFDTRLGLNPSGGGELVGEETAIMNSLEAMGLRRWYLPEIDLGHFVPTSKCTLKHIGDRAEASEIFLVQREPERVSGTLLLGVPRWTYRTALAAWLKWLWTKARGKEDYQHYVHYRQMIGTMRGFRKAMKLAQCTESVSKDNLDENASS